MKAKNEYDELLANGELLELYPDLSGSWQKDKKTFTSTWEQNVEAIKDIDKDFDEDEQI
jgi:hypothetical protein|tara:strand:+ start:9810 stop:9986 length:177 start_codon:yes stop_codon:yes gene_type:complete